MSRHDPAIAVTCLHLSTSVSYQEWVKKKVIIWPTIFSFVFMEEIKPAYDNHPTLSLCRIGSYFFFRINHVISVKDERKKETLKKNEDELCLTSTWKLKRRIKDKTAVRTRMTE